MIFLGSKITADGDCSHEIKRCLLLGKKSYDQPRQHTRRRQWHPTPALLPGKSHGWRSLVGYSPWGSKESDPTERLHFHFHFFPMSKHLLISWLQSPSAVILEAKKVKSVTASIFSPSIGHEVMGPDAMILVS